MQGHGGSDALKFHSSAVFERLLTRDLHMRRPFWAFARWIHARAENTFIAQRQKLRARTSGCLGLPDLLGDCGPRQNIAIPSPSSVPGPVASAEVRRKLQWSQRPEELLQHFSGALKAGRMDSSVVSAAWKRCEQGRWWDALCEVRRLQKPLSCIWPCSRCLCITGASSQEA